MNCVKCIYTRCMSLYTHVVLDLGFCDTSEGKVEEIMNVTRRAGGNTVTSDLIVQPDFVNGGKHHCCSIWRPWYPFSVYGSVCPAVYNSVQMCVYITLRPRQRSVCAWLARMIDCAIWGLVHDLAVPPSTLPMVPSCDRNYNAERNPVSSALKHTSALPFQWLKSGPTVQHLHHYPPLVGLLLRVRVHRRRHREDPPYGTFLGFTPVLFHVERSGFVSWCSRWAFHYHDDVVEASSGIFFAASHLKFSMRVVTCLLTRGGTLSHHMNCEAFKFIYTDCTEY